MATHCSYNSRLVLLLQLVACQQKERRTKTSIGRFYHEYQYLYVFLFVLSACPSACIYRVHFISKHANNFSSNINAPWMGNAWAFYKFSNRKIHPTSWCSEDNNINNNSGKFTTNAVKRTVLRTTYIGIYQIDPLPLLLLSTYTSRPIAEACGLAKQKLQLHLPIPTSHRCVRLSVCIYHTRICITTCIIDKASTIPSGIQLYTLN